MSVLLLNELARLRAALNAAELRERRVDAPTAGCHDAIDYVQGETDRQSAVRWMRQCLAAEAKLTAVQTVVEQCRREARRYSVPSVCEIAIDKVALIVAPGGGTGEDKV